MQSDSAAGLKAASSQAKKGGKRGHRPQEEALSSASASLAGWQCTESLSGHLMSWSVALAQDALREIGWSWEGGRAGGRAILLS